MIRRLSLECWEWDRSPSFQSGQVHLGPCPRGEGRGIDRNPTAAAEILLRGAAEDDGSILTQLTQRTTDWNRDTIAEVQQRLADAGYYTSAVDGLAGPNFTAAVTKWRNGGFDAAVLTR